MGHFKVTNNPSVDLVRRTYAGNLREKSATINHLLQFVETSRCTFLRNGVEYNSKSAVNHIKQKYDYFKNQIRTAEDFVALAATKSELSGRPYFVRCENGKEMPTATWLREELQEYRKTRKDTSRGS